MSSYQNLFLDRPNTLPLVTIQNAPIPQKEVDIKTKEYECLLRQEGVKVFMQLQKILRACCAILSVPLDDPDDHACDIEHYSLTSSTNDHIKCNLTLANDNILQADVEVRYSKAANHVFASVAKPLDTQWKLQQIQDMKNYIQLAYCNVTDTLEDTHRSGMIYSSKMIDCMEQMMYNLHQAKAAVAIPKKKSINELQENRVNKCFRPQLPQDLLLSIYVAGNKLICAAYHMQKQTVPGHHTFHVYQCECVVPWLDEVLTFLNSTLQVSQRFRDKLNVFKNCDHVDVTLEETETEVMVL